MINSYNNSTQTVLTDGVLTFTVDRVKTGCTVTHAAGSTTFSLNRPGYYFVSFNADGGTTATAGNVVLSLQNNGVAVPGAIATAYSAAAENVSNLKFSAIIQVRPACCVVSNATNLTVVNTGVGATLTNANIVITKLA